MKYLLILCLFITACSTKEYPYPKLQGSELTADQLEESLAKLSTEEVVTGKLLLSIRAERKKEIYTFRQAVIFDRNAETKLVLETYPSDAAILISRLIANENDFLFEDFENQEQETGQISDQLIEEYYNLPVSHEELLNIILGKIPKSWLTGIWKGNKDKDQQLLENSQATRFVVADQNKVQSVYLYPPDSRRMIMSASYQQSGELSYQRVFDTDLPAKIVLYIPEYDLKIYVDVRAIDLNDEIQPDIFKFD